MANPPFLPHMIGITVGGSGVANTQVIALNRNTGDTLIAESNSDKVVIFNIEEFNSGYSASDVIEFINVGASVGSTTVTVNSASGGFQEGTISAATAPTVAVDL